MLTSQQFQAGVDDAIPKFFMFNQARKNWSVNLGDTLIASSLLDWATVTFGAQIFGREP